MGFWNDGIRSRSASRSPSRRVYSSSRPARSSSSFFSYGAGSSRGHSRAQPRAGFLHRIRRFFHKIYSYMRRHPLKVFLLVLMPLITGGALSRLLAQFGIRLPRGLENLVGGRQRGADRYFAKGGARDFAGGSALPGMGGGVGESLSSLMGIAKMFI